MHGIPEKEWNDYIEGLADEAARDRIEAHLIGCLSCWEFYEQMVHVTGALRSSGKDLRAVLALSDRQLHSGLQGVFAKLQVAENINAAAESSAPHFIQEKLQVLAAVMSPMCGSHTAAKALQAAAEVSPARSLERVTADNWTPFLKSLKSIAAVMCGETGAHLVWESGQF